MDKVSYSERKLTLEMTFRAKTDVTNAAKMTFRALDTHVLLGAFNYYVHLALKPHPHCTITK